MQQRGSIGIFNLLSIRRSSDLTSTFSDGFSFVSQNPASGNTLVFHPGPPAHRGAVRCPLGQHPRERWQGASTLPSPPLAAGFGFSQADPSTPTLVPFQPCWTLSCLSLPLTVVQFLSSLGSDTEISLSVSAFLFFLMSWLQIQHNCVSGKCWPFNINFILERMISVDWQSLAGLFGIISELLDDIRRSTPGWSQEGPDPQKIICLPMKIRDLTSAHSKPLHLSFWFLL